MDSIAGVLFVDVVSTVEVVSPALVFLFCLVLIDPSDLSSGIMIGSSFSVVYTSISNAMHTQ